MNKKKLGRPGLSGSKKTGESKRITFRVGDDIFEKLSVLGDREGLSPDLYARWIVEKALFLKKNTNS